MRAPASSLREIFGHSRALKVRALVLFFSVTALIACSSPQSKEGESPHATRKSPSQPSRDSKWTYHPTTRGQVRDRLALPSSWLEVDSAGSRWLVPAEGEAQVSPYGAPEALIGIVRQGEKFLSIGVSGAVYVALEALGPFLQVRLPPEEFVQTQRSGKRLVSLSSRGMMFSSDDWGHAWKESSSTKFFVDLASTPEEALLALSVPEQWHISKNEGRSFQVLNLPSIAPRALTRNKEGQPVARGLFFDYLFSEGVFSQTDLSLRKRKRAEQGVRTRMPNFARASAIRRGSALLRGERFARLLPPHGKLSWRLEHGEFDGLLDTEAVEGLGECDAFLFSFNGNVAVVLCSSNKKGEVSPEVSVFVSRDAGLRFTPWEGTFRGNLEGIFVDISHQGRIALGGFCPEDETNPGCAPGGVTLLSAHGKSRKSHFLPGLRHPEAMAFNEEGRLFVAGHRKKDNHLLIFGPIQTESASPKALDLTRRGGLRARAYGVSAGLPLAIRESGSSSRHSDLELLPGPASLAVLAREGEFTRIATVANNGGFEGLGKAPQEGALVHGVGRTLVALSVDGEFLWQSTTGGIVWESKDLPRRACSDLERQCKAALACSRAGCLVGEELTMIGFGLGKSAHQRGSQEEDNTGAATRRLSGYSCQLGGDEWVALPDILQRPTALDAGLGNSAWAQVEEKIEIAMAVALDAPLGQSKIVRRELLPRVANPAAYILHVSQQIEGSAALRYRRPMPFTAASPTVISAKVDIGWDNRIEDLVGGGSLTLSLQNQGLARDAGSFRPALVSVAGRGIYLKMQARGRGRSTYFLSGSPSSFRVEPVDKEVWPRARGRTSGWYGEPEWRAEVREERLRLGGQHGSLLFVGSGRAVVRWRQSKEGRREPSPYLIAKLKSGGGNVLHGARIAYLGREVGFLSMQVDLDKDRSSASFAQILPNGAYGEALNVPLQNHLPPVPAPCDERQRRTTPRVVAPRAESLKREIRIRGLSSETLRLETNSAVLFGTSIEPCVFAWDSISSTKEKPGSSPHYHALVIAGEGRASWIFRESQTSGSRRLLSARTLSCSLDGLADSQ